MKRFSSLTLIAVAMLMVSVAMLGGARAEDASSDAPSDAQRDAPTAAQSDGVAKRLFAGKVAKKKSYACFVRRYDAAHLAAHPLQKVNGMKLLVTAEKLPEDEALNYSFRLGVNFRNKAGLFDSSGDCGHTQVSEISADKLRLGCGVDCDGGGLTVEMAKTDKAVLVRLEAIRIWHNNKPEEEALSLDGGADDRVFRLDRADLEDCRALVADRQELAVMRHK